MTALDTLDTLERASAPSRRLEFAPDALYQVTAGELGVFAVSRGAAPWLRRHVLTLRAGEAAFGLGGPSGERTAWVGVPAPSTDVLASSPDDLAALELATPGATMRLLAAWAEALVDAIAPLPPTRSTVGVGPGPLEASEEGLCAQAERDLLWARIESGPVSWCGVVAPVGSWVPVTRRAWVAVDAGGRLALRDTADAAAREGVWPLVAALGRVVDALLDADAVRAQSEEEERARRKAEADAGHLGRALSAVASAIDGPSRPSDPAPADALVVACGLVFGHLGVRMVVPPERDAPAGLAPAAAHRRRWTRIARASGVRTRQVALSDGWWSTDHGPLLGVREEDGAPVALVSGGGAYEELGADGGRVPVDRERAARFHLFATMFYRPLPPVAVGPSELARYSWPDIAADGARALVLGAVGGLLALLVPVATRVLLDEVIPTGDGARLGFVVAALIGAAVAQALFGVTLRLSLLRLSGRADLSLQAAVFDRLLALPAPFFRQYTAGDLAQRALGVTMIRRQITGATAGVVLTAGFSVFSLALLFVYSVRLASVACVLVAIMAGGIAAASSARLRHEREAAAAQGRLVGSLLQLLSGIARIRVAGAESRAFAVWAALFAEQRRLAMAGGRLALRVEVFQVAVPIAATATLYAAAGASGLSPGAFLAFYAAFGQFSGAVVGLASTVAALGSARPLWERLSPILRELPEVATGRMDPGELTGDLELHQVRFRYDPAGPPVLDGVSIRVAPGELVALVGPSGSGKSTLLRLLLGFERPESGSVRYDGMDLAELDKQQVRSQLGVVLQAPVVLPGPLLGNIVGTSSATLADAWEAARLVGIDQEIAAMPMKMSTIVAPGGGGLSVGQRQRIAIARAIVTRPRILLLDEATSALDNGAQAVVAESLERLDATRVVVAHRLSTIRNADRIYVLERGRVVQQGTYAELVAVPGLFRELTRHQLE